MKQIIFLVLSLLLVEGYTACGQNLRDQLTVTNCKYQPLFEIRTNKSNPDLRFNPYEYKPKPISTKQNEIIETDSEGYTTCKVNDTLLYKMYYTDTKYGYDDSLRIDFYYENHGTCRDALKDSVGKNYNHRTDCTFKAIELTCNLDTVFTKPLERQLNTVTQIYKDLIEGIIIADFITYEGTDPVPDIKPIYIKLFPNHAELGTKAKSDNGLLSVCWRPWESIHIYTDDMFVYYVCIHTDDKQFYMEVKDNGYGQLTVMLVHELFGDNYIFWKPIDHYN